MDSQENTFDAHVTAQASISECLNVLQRIPRFVFCCFDGHFRLRQDNTHSEWKFVYEKFIEA